MPRSLARLSASESSHRDLFSVVFITNIAESDFWYTQELLKLGIKISQATVGRYMPWRPKVPSPTWRSFLRNHLPDIAAIDMFVVATATFRLLYALIVLRLDRRRVIHFDVSENPTQVWLSRQMTEAFPWDTAPPYLLRDRDKSYGLAFRHRVRAMGVTEVTLAEPICRALDWLDPS
jgi:putative transposase